MEKTNNTCLSIVPSTVPDSAPGSVPSSTLSSVPSSVPGTVPSHIPDLSPGLGLTVFVPNFVPPSPTPMANPSPSPTSPNPKSRKWLITINNPLQHGLSHDVIKETLHSKYASLRYYCMSDEIGNETHTPHTHVFIYLRNGIHFNSLRALFPGCHLDITDGTPDQCRAYVEKSGKWAEDTKHDTVIEGTFEEWGELHDTSTNQGYRSDIEGMLELIRSGASMIDVLEAYPHAYRNLNSLMMVRELYRKNDSASAFRHLEVTYIYGPTGTGKTRMVMEAHAGHIYRITDYKHPFDGYDGEDVILFDEYRSQLPLYAMLNYLDGYPLELPCRYSNKTALYTKVFIISNISLDDQYKEEHWSEPQSWQAFLRRIHHVHHLGKKAPVTSDNIA